MKDFKAGGLHIEDLREALLHIESKGYQFVEIEIVDSSNIKITAQLDPEDTEEEEDDLDLDLDLDNIDITDLI